MASKVLFLGTPDFALPSLKILNQHTELVGVITQPDRPAGRKMHLRPSPVSQTSSAFQVPIFKCESPLKILGDIKRLKADCALVVAYGQILKQEFLDAFPKGVINLHASLLPRWRGAAPIQRALMAGDSTTGVCLQKVVKKLDAGPLLGKKSYNIPKDMTADKLYLILSQMGADLVANVFLKYLKGVDTQLKKQDESSVTYAPKITKEEGLINFNHSAEHIFNQYRGLFIWPGVWIKRFDQILKTKKMRISHQRPLKKVPGQIINVSPQVITICCGSPAGAIDILELQPNSKRCMTVSEYINGHPVQVGEVW